MLYAGLGLSRKRLDFRLLDADGATVDVGASPPDADRLRGLSARLDRRSGHRKSARANVNYGCARRAAPGRRFTLFRIAPPGLDRYEDPRRGSLLISTSRFGR
jgi:hypothetical protein